MQLFTIKNNETGKIKGGSVDVVLDIAYYDLIQEHINHNADEYSNDEIKAIMGGWDIGYYVEFGNEFKELTEPVTAGRYTITPIA